MTIVGDAYVRVHADTSKVKDQIRDAFNGVRTEAARAGDAAGSEFNKSFSRASSRSGGGGKGIFSKKFQDDADRARIAISNMVVATNFLGPALFGLVGAVASLGAGLFSLAAAAGQAGPALIVLPGIFTAVAQSAITLKLAFSGVGAALSAGLKSGGGAAKAKRDLDGIKRALDGVAAARRRLAEIIKDNAVRRIEAQEAVRDAEERVQDAILGASAAERSYQQALLTTRDAQERLNDARKEAVEDLQQLRFESEGAAISEKRARIELDRARETLQRVQDLPPNSRARREAELAFAEADLNLRRAIDKNADLKKEEAAASKAGVEGSKKVIDAQRNLNNAKYAEQSALQDVIAAQKEIARARLDSARASRALSQVEQENAQRQKDAVEALKEALQNVDKERRKAFESNRGAGGRDPFAEAMKKLSKEAQDFVRYLLSIQGEFKKLKAAAGKELFPKLETALRTLVSDLFPRLAPLLQGTGSALGDVAIKIANTITQGDNLRRLESVWKTGDYLIRAFGDAASNLYTVFLVLMDAAGPLIKRFADWVVSVTDAWKSSALLGEKTGSLTEMFNRAGNTAAQLGKIFSNVFGGLNAMFKSAVGPGSGGQFLLDFFQQATAKFKALRQEGNADGSLKKYFLDSSVNASLVLSLLNDIFKAIMRTASAPEIGQFAQLLREVVRIWEQIANNFTSSLPLLGTLAITVSEILLAFSDSGGVELFFTMLNQIADVIKSIVQSDFSTSLLGYIVAITAVAAAFRFAGKILFFFVKAAFGWVAFIPKMILANTSLGNSFNMTAARIRAQANLMARDFKKVGFAAITMERMGKLAMLGLKMAFMSTGIGAAIVVVTSLIFAFAEAQMNAKMAADALTDSVDKQTGAFTDESIRLVTEAFREDITTKTDWLMIDKYVQLSQEEMAAAVLKGGQAYKDLQEKIEMAKEAAIKNTDTTRAGHLEQTKALKALDGLSSSLANQNKVANDSREQLEIARINQERLNSVNTAAEVQTNKYSDAVERQAKRAAEAALAQEELKAATEAVNKALDDLTGALDISQAKDDLARATRTIRKELKGVNLDLSTSKGMENFRDKFRDASKQVIADAQRIGGSPAEIEANVKKGMQSVTAAFLKSAPNKEQAQAAIKDFKGELGLLPNQISTTLKTAADEAKKKARDQYKPTGQASADGYIAGMRSRFPQVYDAGGDMFTEGDRGARDRGGISSPSKVFAKIGGYVVDGFVKGIDDNGEKVINAFDKLVDKLIVGSGDKIEELKEKTKNRFKEFVDDVGMVGAAFKDMKDAFTEALKVPEILPEKPAERAAAVVAEANKQLDALGQKLSAKGVLKDKEAVIAGFSEVTANLKEGLVSALQLAQANYDEVKQRFLTFKDSVASALSGAINLSGAIETAKETGGSITDALNAQAAKAREFAATVRKLISEGFSLQSIQTVLGAGVGAGTEIGNSLLAGGKDAVAVDKSIAEEMKTLAAEVAALAKPAFFDAGEEEAKAQLDGVKAQMNEQLAPGSKLMNLMDRLARKLGRDVKIDVSISKSEFDVVLNVSKKYVNSASEEGATVAGAAGGIVRRPTYALIGESGPEAVIPLGKSAGNSPLPDGLGLGRDINIVVNPSTGMDEVELAKLVSRELAFQMRRGAA